MDDYVLVVYILLEFDKPLEVALMGYWFLSRKKKKKKKMKKKKMKKPMYVCMWKVMISREKTWEVE